MPRMPDARGRRRSALRSVRSDRASAPRCTLAGLRRGQRNVCSRLRRVCGRGLRPCRVRARADLPIRDAQAPALGIGLRPHRLFDARRLLAARGVVQRLHLLDRLIAPLLSIEAAGQERGEETHEDRVTNWGGPPGPLAQAGSVRLRHRASGDFPIRHLNFASPGPLQRARSAQLATIPCGKKRRQSWRFPGRDLGIVTR
jgi:hypothetical protein